MIKIKKLIEETLFPLSFTCDCCGIETFKNNLCPACLKKLRYNSDATCPVCGRKTPLNEICMECKKTPPYFEQAVSPLIYDGTAIKLINKFKNGYAYLKDYFANLIIQKISVFPIIDYITYVPMTKRAERKRGYNQSKLLAESVGEKLNVPVISTVIKINDTAEQKNLSVKERVENLEKSFKTQTQTNLKLKTVLLIDDIMTTGNTANALCKKLVPMGTLNIFFASVASVEYKH